MNGINEAVVCIRNGGSVYTTHQPAAMALSTLLGMHGIVCHQVTRARVEGGNLVTYYGFFG